MVKPGQIWIYNNENSLLDGRRVRIEDVNNIFVEYTWIDFGMRRFELLRYFESPNKWISHTYTLSESDTINQILSLYD